MPQLRRPTSKGQAIPHAVEICAFTGTKQEQQIGRVNRGTAKQVQDTAG